MAGRRYSTKPRGTRWGIGLVWKWHYWEMPLEKPRPWTPPRGRSGGLWARQQRGSEVTRMQIGVGGNSQPRSQVSPQQATGR